jgi:predicted metalloprotease with PDZ domain
MEATNYLTVELSKPMGIVFEENDADYGGIFVHSLKAGGAAESNGALKTGDQLVGVAGTKVAGLPFDDALGTITATEAATLKLVFFRGTAVQLYGPTGASQAWLDEFITGAAPPKATTADAVAESEPAVNVTE